MTHLIETAQAMQAMLTAQPFQMMAHAGKLEKARHELEDASHATGIAAMRRDA